MIVFWCSAGLLLYAFVCYPVSTYLLSKIVRYKTSKDDTFQPEVTLIIPARNEEHVIEEKICNSLELDYPKEKLQIIIASDGSTDRTDEIAKRYEGRGITSVIFSENIGKAELLNKTIPEAKGEIIVISDASGMLNNRAVREMAKNFADKKVGCVCGIYHIEGKKKSRVDRFEERYYNFETLLKRSESSIYTTLGGHGALVAIRKDLFIPLKRDTLNDDFIISSRIVLKGFRTIYEGRAHVYDKIHTTLAGEFRRRVRIAAGNWQQIYLLRDFIGAGRYFVALQFFSHKILRTITPFLLFILFFSCIILEGTVFKAIIALLLGGLLLAVLGCLTYGHTATFRFVSIPFFIFLENAAYALGAYKYFFARKTIKW